MKVYNCCEAPLKVFGIPFFDEHKRFERLPLDLREKIPTLKNLGKRCPGARVKFRTDAQEFRIRVTLKTLSPGASGGLAACQGVSVMIGDRQCTSFAGLSAPPDFETKVFEDVFKKSDKMEDVTLWLLRKEEIDSIEVIVPKTAVVLEPTPYKHGKALFYGSSITEGWHSGTPANDYSAILSRWLDMDYYNFGFAANAKAELDLADYINTIDFNLFVFDYDHNAPNVDFLKETHEPFFKRIREKHPDVPILMMSGPNFEHLSEAKERREVILKTYNNALSSGDKNVYFIDGETFFGEKDRLLCTVDTVHPNDLGFYRMAKVIFPVMKKMIENATKKE